MDILHRHDHSSFFVRGGMGKQIRQVHQYSGVEHRNCWIVVGANILLGVEANEFGFGRPIRRKLL